MPDFAHFATDGVLRDGGSIHIRAIRPDDKQRLVDHFHSLSPRSVHFRFFGAKRRLTDAELARFTELDFVRNVALVATLTDGDGEKIVGVGRYMATAESRAEVAFAVADDHQGRGIGSMLLDHLAEIARANGISEFEADVLGENNQMLAVFRRSGFVVKRSMESGVVHVWFPTEETAESAQSSLERQMRASAESVRHFLQPQSIAVVGASGRADSLGGAVLRNLQRGGYRGAIHPVHRRAATIKGLRSYRSLGEIGQAPELAIIAVPAAEVSEVVGECGRAGVRAVVVLSPEFGDASEKGREAEQALAHQVREAGMRLLGPNCLGVLNQDPAFTMNATFAARVPAAGRVAISAQSAAIGLALLDHAAERGLGVSSFISVGNKADVSGNDLLSYWATDPATAAVALYLESFGNPRRFARIAPRVAEAKPIVALKAGRTPPRGGGATGIGLLADVDVAADALFEQAGVIRTDTIEELFGVLTLLASQPLPPGPRVGVVGNADGPATLFADACEARGLVLPAFDPATTARLRGVVGEERRVANPLQLPATAPPEAYETALAAIGAEGCVDAVVALNVPTLGCDSAAIAAAIARGAASVPPEKPVVTVFLSARGAPAELHRGSRGALPCYSFPENAALALAAAEGHARWRRRPRGSELELDATATGMVRAVIERTRREGSALELDAADLAVVLRAAGIPFAETHTVAPEDAAEFADTLGYPLVAKAVAPALAERRESGCLAVGLYTRADVERTTAAFQRRVEERGLKLAGVSLQRDYSSGIEAIAGVTNDPRFGPLVVCGLGNVLVEIARDVAVRLTPLTDVAAREMISSLRASRLLQGYRDVGPGDGDALASLLLRLSALVEIAPEIREIELEPISVLPPGQGVMVLGGKIRF